MEFMGTWIATAVACAAAIYFIPGINAVGGDVLAPIFAALALALINATVKPVAQFLSFPITLLTLGIFYLVVNGVMLELASYLSRNVFSAGIAIDSFGDAFVGSIFISIVSMIVAAIIGV